MFRRRPRSVRRAPAHRARTYRSPFLYGRKPLFELLEDRRVLAVFVVDNVGDAGAGTLRQAITDANATANVGGVPDDIQFAIPGAGPHTITLASALPSITESVVIDGFTEMTGGAAAPNTNPTNMPINATMLIVVDGGGGAFDGFTITSTGGGSTIRGLVIQNFMGNGVSIVDSDDNVVAGNFVGTNAAGDGAVANITGVSITEASMNNRVGGTAAADRNLISGNSSDGVFMSNGATMNSVLGNFIGSEADGTTGLGNGANGVWLNDTANSNTVGGTTDTSRNVIVANMVGVRLNSVSGSMVQGNYIGLDRTGEADLGNSQDGVVIEDGATNNTIGGANVAARNIISGNNSSGVQIQDAGTTGNTVLGNYIGTNAAGTSDFGNSGDGVRIRNGASGNTIGGTASGAGNVISGNNGDGVDIRDDGTDGNMVLGNLIGTSHTGTVALANSDNGVQISNGAANNSVGGTASGSRNVISANSDDGVDIRGDGTDGNMVQGNFIGTASDGTSDLGNGGDGVEISNGAQDNLVGGTADGAGNTIAFNDDGVAIQDDDSINNAITRNSIRNNDNLGIDLGDNGMTPNDPDDPDEGPNRIQNFPVFVGNATLLGNSIALRYFVDTATANATYPLAVEFFVADSDNQEGQTYLATDMYEAGEAETTKMVIIPAAPVLTNSFILATATDADGNTSEFSFPVQITLPTILGSEPTIIRPNEEININQVNQYQYIAHSTGKLVVRIDFLHFFGDLALEVRDEFGNLLAMSDSSSADQNFEQVIIPVVTQERYYINVIAVDFQDDFGQTYALEVENFPAPVPSGVHLDPLSDTGMMNNDGVTRDKTPTLFIQTDVLNFVDTNNDGIYVDPDFIGPPAPPAVGHDAIDALTAAQAQAILDGMPMPGDESGGIAVQITLVNTTTGMSTSFFANPLIASIPEVYVFTPAANLAAGTYMVSARTFIFDGQGDAMGDPDQAMGRSNASPPLWFTIDCDPPFGGFIDLLSHSDSGMYDYDHVTNKMSPAFYGRGEPNAKVYIYAQRTDLTGAPLGEYLRVGSGVVSNVIDFDDDIPFGEWEVTVEPLVDGKYNFVAVFEDAAGNISDPVGLSAEVFTMVDTTIPNDGTPLDSTVEIAPADFPGLVGNAADMVIQIVDLNVTINIEHDNDEDLDVILIAPDGTEIVLTSDNGGSGDDYFGTIFDQSAGTSIVDGMPPFTGRFRPEESLAQLNGLSPFGMWTLRVIDDSNNDFTGELLNWTLEIDVPLMMVIDTVAPNTPFLDLITDTGRNDHDNITKDNMPVVTMTTSDLNVALSQLLWTDNFKFRLYDRFENSAEFLLYDSALDPDADAIDFAGDMFTAETFLSQMLPNQYFDMFGTNAAVIDVDGVGKLADGVHNLKLEVEDRAGNISHDFILEITIDTETPPVSFGLPTTGEDGLAADSDSGVVSVPATFADRITNDTTPRLWGRAEANSVVRVFLDVNYDGIIDLDDDIFLGQTVAVPFDGNDAYPDGYWELNTTLDLNQIVGLPLDGLRRLLVTAEDVAGNPMPMEGIIEDGVEELQIFIDTQGPQITGVFVTGYEDFDLFDPKPSQAGPTPLVFSLTIAVRDLPSRVFQDSAFNDFLYEALVEGIAESPGNYLLVGDHVGIIPIQSIVVNNENPADYMFSGTLTAVVSTSVITDVNLVGAAEQPVVGDYILIDTGAAAGQVRRIVAYNAATGQMTLDQPLLNLPAAGDDYTITTFAEAEIVLQFAAPLPDDRYTLTVEDALVDPAGNHLDGETNSTEPQAPPIFPTGDGVPGGDFFVRFTVDSRPEIGSYVSKDIDIDINGNFIWDPAPLSVSGDGTNVDLSFTLPVANANGTVGLGGFGVHDLLVAGKFRPLNGNGGENGEVAALNGIGHQHFFDQLAAYGFSGELGVFRWIIDTNSDGVVTLGTDVLVVQSPLVNFDVAGAIPVAGNFDGNVFNGDEIGLYNHGVWALDTSDNGVYEIDTLIFGNMLGQPIVGDFDGNGEDDLGVFNNNIFYFDLNTGGFDGFYDQTLVLGYPGVLDKPVAADMDADGIDDIGLWVPRNSASLPQGISEWYFWISNDYTGNLRVPGTINTLDHAFTVIPFGNDIFAEFGDERALPIVGNFDPPVVAQTSSTASTAASTTASSSTQSSSSTAAPKAASTSAPATTPAETTTTSPESTAASTVSTSSTPQSVVSTTPATPVASQTPSSSKSTSTAATTPTTTQSSTTAVTQTAVQAAAVPASTGTGKVNLKAAISAYQNPKSAKTVQVATPVQTTAKPAVEPVSVPVVEKQSVSTTEVQPVVAPVKTESTEQPATKAATTPVEVASKGTVNLKTAISAYQKPGKGKKAKVAGVVATPAVETATLTATLAEVTALAAPPVSTFVVAAPASTANIVVATAPKLSVQSVPVLSASEAGELSSLAFSFAPFHTEPLESLTVTPLAPLSVSASQASELLLLSGQANYSSGSLVFQAIDELDFTGGDEFLEELSGVVADSAPEGALAVAWQDWDAV